MRVTLRDIAARANVSKQAVSAALRGRASTSRVSPELRARILAAAQEMGYQPNLLARALAEKRTGLFVTTCDNLRDPHFEETILAVEEQVRAAGFTTCVLRPETDRPDADLLLYQMADAVLHLTRVKQVARTARLAPSIRVCLPHDPELGEIQFYWDERDGARDIAAHAAALGHRAAAILAGAHTARRGGVPERVHFLTDALENAGVQALPIWEETETDPVALGSAGLVRALTECPAATVVIGRNDRFTLGAYLECLRRGIAIPERLSLISFVDTALLATVVPFVTSVRSPLRDAAVAAARSLIRHVQEGEALEPDRKWRPTLMVRQSTACPRAG